LADEDVVLEARTDSERTCPHCGDTFDLPERGPGRRPVWCSPRCRRLASAQRVAARNVGAAVRVIEVPRAHKPQPDARLPLPAMHTLMMMFLGSEYMCRLLLETIETRYKSGAIDGDLKVAAERFAASVRIEQALSEEPVHQQAGEELKQLRSQLVAETQHAKRRGEDLDRLYRENASLRARLGELESRLSDADPPPRETPRHGQSPSRQQRRAAERAARRKP
jgi:hypothetical protein